MQTLDPVRRPSPEADPSIEALAAWFRLAGTLVLAVAIVALLLLT
jgi:hypothetical protein